MSDPTFYSDWELVEDNVEFEYKTYYSYIAGGTNLIILRQPKRRKIRSKTYCATIQEDPTTYEIAPSYLAGSTTYQPNPESLSPVGNRIGQWRCDNVSYTKELSVPYSRVIRVTWVMTYSWEDVDESESI